MAKLFLELKAMNNDPNNKQVDGIKKINKSEIKKSRELVLNSIGEDNLKPEKKDIPKSPDVEKRLDGLSPRPSTVKKPVLDPKKVDTLKSILGEETQQEKKSVPFDSLTSSNKKTVDQTGQIKQVKKKQVKKEKKKKPKKKIVNPVKKKVKTIKNRPSLGEIIKAKKFRFYKKLNEINKKITNFFVLFKLALVKAIKKALAFLVLIIAVFIFIYLFLALVVLNFGKNSPVITALSAKVPIPALISVDGLIHFKEYKNIVKTANIDLNDKQALNESLASIFILNELFEKHNTTDLTYLKKILPFDHDVNIAPFNRIKKIKATIQSQEDFVKISKKLGDVGQANISESNSVDFDFSPFIKNIQKDETSDIITTPSGYYIVHCFDRDIDNLSVSYVYIPSTSLEDYLREASKNYKFWNLTNF